LVGSFIPTGLGFGIPIGLFGFGKLVGFGGFPITGLFGYFIVVLAVVGTGAETDCFYCPNTAFFYKPTFLGFLNPFPVFFGFTFFLVVVLVLAYGKVKVATLKLHL